MVSFQQRKSISYPFGKTLLFYSGLLLLFSLLFTFILLNDLSVLGIYLAIMLTITVLTFLLKVYIYRGVAEEYVSASLKTWLGTKDFIVLILTVLILLLLPFLLLGLFGANVWFVTIMGYIGGFNIS